MTPPQTHSPPPPDRSAARRARVEAIRDAARVRRELSQAALHRRLDDGRHEVIFGGQRFVGQTVSEAIRLANRGER